MILQWDKLQKLSFCPMRKWMGKMNGHISNLKNFLRTIKWDIWCQTFQWFQKPKICLTYISYIILFYSNEEIVKTFCIVIIIWNFVFICIARVQLMPTKLISIIWLFYKFQIIVFNRLFLLQSSKMNECNTKNVWS